MWSSSVGTHRGCENHWQSKIEMGRFMGSGDIQFWNDE